MLGLLLLICAVNGAFHCLRCNDKCVRCSHLQNSADFAFTRESINAFEKIINHFYSLRELEQNMQALLPV